MGENKEFLVIFFNNFIKNKNKVNKWLIYVNQIFL